ncbi:hypothetical protein Cgig2_014386 [Carnegiea gigantea]|uniref:RNase H type-1 domain-containing protein n=1 Tax=Carnegiea gigantea TaxID=171969 RepID=A0A9Q1JPT1_9CARY|nr:hypothetical protein Cgig2_014386 [Carnegiea gigantea]
MWALDPSCVDTIRKAWLFNTQEDEVCDLVTKIDACSKELAWWNKRLRLVRDPLERKNILGAISQWRKKEVLWWQRARSNYLKYENANTRWFHSRACMRRARNHINSLQNEDNQLCTSHEEIEKIRNELVKELFLPCDAELILTIPLYDSWLEDKLVWHFTMSGEFSMRSAYHVLLEQLDSGARASMNTLRSAWKSLWALEVPPRIRLFGWRLCSGILPIPLNIVHGVLIVDTKCAICGACEESDVHALLEWPLVIAIWEGSGIDHRFWALRVRVMADCILRALKEMNYDEFGELLAILWECWNTRNRVVFKKSYRRPQILGERAILFMRSYRASHAQETEKQPSLPVLWQPPEAGVFKLNFDGCRIREQGRGWGFVVRSCDGDILLAGVDQGDDFAGAEVEEARACLFGLRSAQDASIQRLVVEGDCLQLMQKLKLKKIQDNCVGFYGVNRVAHDLAHWLPFSHGKRIWVDDVPDSIVNRASDDMYTVIDSKLMQ